MIGRLGFIAFRQAGQVIGNQGDSAGIELFAGRREYLSELLGMVYQRISDQDEMVLMQVTKITTKIMRPAARDGCHIFDQVLRHICVLIDMIAFVAFQHLKAGVGVNKGSSLLPLACWR